MRGQARVVIIGGGMLGVSLLYALAKEGWKDVVLIEKGELTSGSTWHAAGVIPALSPSVEWAHLYRHTIETYRAWQNDSKIDFNGWRPSGGARLALNELELDCCRNVASKTAAVGLDVSVLSADRLKELHPFASMDDVVGGVYSPQDGSVDPAMACQTMATLAKSEGAEIILRTLVTGLKQSGSGAWCVETQRGTILADHVVNAAGCYAREVARMAGTDIALMNLKHQYFVTDDLPELVNFSPELPILRDSSLGGYYRQEQRSMLIGPWEFNNIESAWDGGAPEWKSENELFTDNLERIEYHIKKAVERLPLIANSGVKTIVNGAISFTPDGNPHIGPAQGLRNFWHCCGSSIGIAHGPAIGHYLAQQMIYGCAEINMVGFDPRRFGIYATDEYQMAKAIDIYSVYARPPAHGENRAAGRPARITPIYAEQKARGAEFQEANGWERPIWFLKDGMPQECSYRRESTFDLIGDECRAVRERVGVIDLSSFSSYEVTGSDAAKLLNWVCANKLPKRDGRLALTPVLTENGRIFSEWTVVRLSEDRYYVTTGAVAELRDWDHTQFQIDELDVSFRNVSSETGILAVVGPDARAVLSKLTNADLTNKCFKWLSAQEITISGIPALAIRVSYVGELGWELHVDMARMAELYSNLLTAGEEFTMADIGFGAINSLRLEKGYRGWGHELTNEMNVYQAGVERFVDLSKSFTGRNATLSVRDYEPNYRIALCEIVGSDADALGGETCWSGDDVIGNVTSGGYGYTVQKSLAFVWVKAKFATPGSLFKVDILGNKHEARMLSGIPYDPGNKTVSG